MGVGLVRVDADARPDIRLALGQADDLGPFALAGGNVEETADPCFPGTGEDALLVLDQALVIEVAVGIDQHQAASSSGRVRGGERRLPAARR